jgi:hypothetical protein
MLLGKNVNPPFEIRVETKTNVPLVEFDSDRSGQGPSAENLVGHEEAKLLRFRAVILAAEPLDDLLLRDGTVSHMVTLQRAGTILVL